METAILFSAILAILGLSCYAFRQLQQAQMRFMFHKRIQNLLIQTNQANRQRTLSFSTYLKRPRQPSPLLKPFLILTIIAMVTFILQWWLSFSWAAKLSTGIFYILGCLTVLMIQTNVQTRREKQFINELPDALDLMARAAAAGHAMSETIALVAENFSGLLGSEFRQISHNIQMGYTLQEALQEAAQRIHLSEFRFFTIIIHLHQQTGGNIVRLLNQLSNTLRKKHSTNQKIKSLSAEAVASGIIIGVLPLVIIAAIAIFSPHYVSPLLTTTTGHLVMISCLIMQILGTLVMKRLIRIEL